jgi:hypothetical protein
MSGRNPNMLNESSINALSIATKKLLPGKWQNQYIHCTLAGAISALIWTANFIQSYCTSYLTVFAFCIKTHTHEKHNSSSYTVLFVAVIREMCTFGWL